MLIESHRHTEADLTLWREMEEADRLRGGRFLATGKVRKSIAAIREFAASGPCYCGTSWGKDSTVLVHLLGLSKTDVPLVWMRYGRATNPGCEAVRDEMLWRWPGLDYREIEVGEAEDQRDDFSLAVKATGASRYISGVRADESGIRKIVMRRWGIVGEQTCRPLGWWTGEEVFGYLCVAELPVHQNYAMLGGGRWPRRHLRTASIGGERGVENGRREWEQEYYGDVLRRLRTS